MFQKLLKPMDKAETREIKNFRRKNQLEKSICEYDVRRSKDWKRYSSNKRKINQSMDIVNTDLDYILNREIQNKKYDVDLRETQTHIDTNNIKNKSLFKNYKSDKESSVQWEYGIKSSKIVPVKRNLVY